MRIVSVKVIACGVSHRNSVWPPMLMLSVFLMASAVAGSKDSVQVSVIPANHPNLIRIVSIVAFPNPRVTLGCCIYLCSTKFARDF